MLTTPFAHGEEKVTALHTGIFCGVLNFTNKSVFVHFIFIFASSAPFLVKMLYGVSDRLGTLTN